MLLFDFFQEAYCINLAHRPDKWLKAEQEFKQAGLKVKRHEGVHNRMDGAHGCALSHLQVYNQCRGNKNVLVFEDDVTFFHDLSHVSEALQQLPSTWELVYLGGIVFPDQINSMKIAPNVYKAKNVVCTHAIGLSNAGLARVLRHYRYRRGLPIDEFYRSVIQPTGNAYVIHPMVATQRPGLSDITHKEGGPNELHITTNKKFK